jgi:hypothetical protein
MDCLGPPEGDELKQPYRNHGGVTRSFSGPARPALDRIQTDVEVDPYGGVESPDVEQRQGPTIHVSSPKADHGELLDEFPQTPKQADSQASAQLHGQAQPEAQMRPRSLVGDVKARRTSSLIASRGQGLSFFGGVV